MRTPVHWLLPLVPLLMLNPGGGWAQGEADPVTAVAMGSQQARASIRTITAEFEVRQDLTSTGAGSPKPQSVYRIKWTQTGETARWRKESEPVGRIDEYLWKDDKLKVLHESRQSPQNASGTLDPSWRPERELNGLWYQALFVVPEGNYRLLPAVMRDAKFKVAARQIQEAGRQLWNVRISTQQGELRRESWLDPARNYLTVKTIGYYDAHGTQIERQVVTSKEVKPGIFFPEKVEHRVLVDGKLSTRHETVFTKVAINEEVDPAALELRFPEGLVVADAIENKHYKVDQKEQPVPGSERQVPLSKEEQLRLEAIRPWYLRSTIWLWLAAGLSIATGGIWLLTRGRRSRVD